MAFGTNLASREVGGDVMKNRNEKIKSKNVVSLIEEKIVAITNQRDKSENEYFQINKISFERNFKALMTHYKNDEAPAHSQIQISGF